MGFRDRWRFVRRAASFESAPAAQFSADPIEPVDQLIVATNRMGWNLSVSRQAALQVPAVLRGRNLICSIATLPLRQYGPNRAVERSSLLEQLDPQTTNVVTLAQLVEDLLFDGIGWLRVIGRGWNDFPVSVQHVDNGRVHLNPPPGAQSLNMLPSGEDPSAAVWVDTEVVAGRDMLRFDSPNPPLLVAARRAIRRAAVIERVAEMYANDPAPRAYWTPADGADPAEDTDITAMLDDFAAARLTRTEAYIPAAVKRVAEDVMSPVDLQLADLQKRAALDIANAMGLDPEDLGISTTSRTYLNGTDRRQDRINDTYAPFMRAVTDRFSMGDVTRRGYTVRFDLSDYLKADPKTRAEVAVALSGIDALTVDEIREQEGRPELTSAQRRELAPAPVPQAAPVQPMPPAPMPGGPMLNTAVTSAAFSDDTTGFVFDAGTAEFAASVERRTVSGLLLPFGPVARNQGRKWRFAPGSVEWNKAAVSRVKLNRDHDRSQLLGAATEVTASEQGVFSRFKVGRGQGGDQALSLAEDQVLDGLSAEVDILEYAPDPADKSVQLVSRAVLTGAALTATPAFSDARLTSVAASVQPEGNTAMPCSTCGQVHAPGTPCATPTTVTPPAPAAAPVQFTADQLAAIGTAAAAALAEQGPAVVNPRRTASTVVREPLPYAFGGRRSEHDFSTDLFEAARTGDGEAKQRLDQFMQAAFVDDVSTGDVNELNPTRNRPDLFVDNLDFTSPVWTSINKGSIADSTPFTVPAFNSAATLVSDHSEGTEPTAGTYTTTGQTITPTSMSGVVEITRETIDQGGNPQVSTLIWNEIQRAWREALEVKAVAMLDALAPTGIVLNGTDADLDADLTANLAALQYIRGGNRFQDFYIASDLYGALAGAVDDDGRKLYPIVAPQNANGTTAPDFSYIQIGSLRARPAWALEVANGGDGSSYLFNSGDVHGWATAPRRLDFQYQVKSVWLGVWGHVATANTRLAGVREVTYSAV